jgi:hypothetical protein
MSNQEKEEEPSGKQLKQKSRTAEEDAERTIITNANLDVNTMQKNTPVFQDLDTNTNPADHFKQGQVMKRSDGTDI